MAFQHHGSDQDGSNIRKLFEQHDEARKRFTEQTEGRAKRSYSDGRIGPDDDGDLAFSIGRHPDKELVVIDFGKPVTFVAMQPQQAVELAQSLIKHARAMSSDPLRIVLH